MLNILSASYLQEQNLIWKLSTTSDMRQFEGFDRWLLFWYLISLKNILINIFCILFIHVTFNSGDCSFDLWVLPKYCIKLLCSRSIIVKFNSFLFKLTLSKESIETLPLSYPHSKEYHLRKFNSTMIFLYSPFALPNFSSLLFLVELPFAKKVSPYSYFKINSLNVSRLLLVVVVLDVLLWLVSIHSCGFVEFFKFT